MRACCARCESSLVRRSVIARSNSRTAAVATAALIIYPFAVGLPIMSIERFGHVNEVSILEGVTSLLGGGQWFVGIVVLLCSIVLPLGKLVSLLVLSAGGLGLRHRHRALTYRIVEWTGRWGMLDVLLVAILVAILKLGDMVEVRTGPAALAFTVCVLLSLVAAACFDPHGLWMEEGIEGRRDEGTKRGRNGGPGSSGSSGTVRGETP
jgi:paraquat-inducible protein A